MSAAKLRRLRFCGACKQQYHMTAAEIIRHAELCESGKGIELPRLVVAKEMPKKQRPDQGLIAAQRKLNRIARDIMAGKR